MRVAWRGSVVADGVESLDEARAVVEDGIETINKSSEPLRVFVEWEEPPEVDEEAE